MFKTSVFKFGVAVETPRRHKLPGINQISAELIRVGDGVIRFETHKLYNSIWNKEELSVKWKESIIVPIFKKGVKTDCSNYGGLSLLSTTCKIFSNILISSLIPYAGEIIGDHQCGFRRSRSITHYTFCICQILEKKNWTKMKRYISYL